MRFQHIYMDTSDEKFIEAQSKPLRNETTGRHIITCMGKGNSSGCTLRKSAIACMHEARCQKKN